MRRSKKTIAEKHAIGMRALQLAQVHIHRAACQLSTISKPRFHPHLKESAMRLITLEAHLRTVIAQFKTDVEFFAMQHAGLYEETLKLERESVKLQESTRWAPNPQPLEYWRTDRKCDSILGCGCVFITHDEVWVVKTDMRVTLVCAACVRLLGLIW